MVTWLNGFEKHFNTLFQANAKHNSTYTNS